MKQKQIKSQINNNNPVKLTYLQILAFLSLICSNKYY